MVHDGSRLTKRLPEHPLNLSITVDALGDGSSVASKRSQIHEETAEFIDEHAFKKETNKLTNKKDKPWIVEMRLEDLLLVVNG